MNRVNRLDLCQCQWSYLATERVQCMIHHPGVMYTKQACVKTTRVYLNQTFDPPSGTRLVLTSQWRGGGSPTLAGLCIRCVTLRRVIA